MKATKEQIANLIQNDETVKTIFVQGHEEEVSKQDAIDFLDTYKACKGEEFAYSYGAEGDFFIWIN